MKRLIKFRAKHITNGAMFLAFATYGIYGLISVFQNDKEIHDPDCPCREKGGVE